MAWYMAVLLLPLMAADTLQLQDDFYYGTFPEGFLWSTATASYQVEGGYNADGKGPSIWDVFVREKGKIVDGETGDVACDSYHLYREDVKLLKSLGVSHYRFSISWPRVMPHGTNETINQPGLDYYNRLINELLANGIQPMVTLYHWDLPQELQERGGWLNEEIVDWYTEYARLCFKTFGDRVKFWITMNEPFVVAVDGHENGSKAPGLKGPGVYPYIVAHNIIKSHSSAFHVYDQVKFWITVNEPVVVAVGGYENGDRAPGVRGPGVYPYIVAHNIIKSHASAFHLYDQVYRPTQKGKIGITLSMALNEAKNASSQSDIEAAERANQFEYGWFAHPIALSGDYPEVMRSQVDRKSKEAGFPTSRLPHFTQAEIARNKGTADFLGLNYYTSLLASAETLPASPPSFRNDQDVHTEQDPKWPKSGSSWLRYTPKGARRVLNWLKHTYNNMDVYVTENGVSDNNGSLHDLYRINYYREYLDEMLKAVRLDGCNLKGYTSWSLMDNFEWARGYSEKFGLHYVNFSDPSRPRIPKESAKFYAQVIADNGFKKKTLKSTGIPHLNLIFLYKNVILYNYKGTVASFFKDTYLSDLTKTKKKFPIVIDF